MSLPQPNQSSQQLKQIIEEFIPDIIPIEELASILRAVRTLKKESGWGEIKILYTGSDLNKIDIIISLRPTKPAK